MVIILRGISGSGKSSLVDHLIKHREQKLPVSNTEAQKFLCSLMKTPDLVSYSADYHFMLNGNYVFDPRYLPAAHRYCMQAFTKDLVNASATGGNRTNTMVVDNTNTTLVEVLPYIALAEAFGQEIHVVTLVADPVECLKRNKHGVPFSSIIRQDINLRKSIAEWPDRMASYQQIFPE